MELYKLADFKRGWVVGNFEPSLHKGNFEVGVHFYPSGTHHEYHYHKETEEINIVTDGTCIFVQIEPQNATYRQCSKGDVVLIKPNEVVGFTATSDCELTVIKTKSVPGDKYLW